MTDVISIRLLDRDYQIKCPHEKASDLQEVATLLDTKMRESKENTKSIQTERIILITALNITHELLMLKRQHHHYLDNMSERIQELSQKISEALAQ